MTKTTTQLAAFGLAAVLAHSAAADSTWNGTLTNNLWSNPNNWSPVGVPPPGNPTTTFQGNVYLDAANGDSVITIAAGDVESPGVGNTNEVYNTIFGPEWGVTLNIYGTLNYDWFLFPVQNDPAPANRGKLNLFTNAVVTTSGAALGVGDSWFYTGAPYVTVNLYGNAQHNSLGSAGLWLGGHLNIYDVSTVTIGTGGGGYVNMDTAGPMSDGTRCINMGGGTLILPPGFSSTVNNWISRGILRAYGNGFDYNDVVITDNGTNVVVTTAPLGGALQQVYFQPLLLTNLQVGAFQQSILVGDYPAVTGVLLSSSEPGLSPSSFSPPVYTSSNTNVLSADTNGLITAVGPGSATLTARVGALSTTNSVQVTVTPMGGNLIHRYSFSETSGSTSADLVPGNSPTWDASLIGGYTLAGGQVTLDGSSGYVQLPAGILSGLDEVTIETWASFGSPINTWANLFAFGGTDGNGDGMNYIGLQRTGGGTTAATFGQGDPGNNAERNAVYSKTLDGQTNVLVVAVYHPLAGYEALYLNGAQVATISMFNNLIDPVAFAGPTYNSQSILAYTLGGDYLNYLGHSLYNGDPTLNGSIDEFRIYDGPLSRAQVMAAYQAGPNNTNDNPGNLLSLFFASGQTNLPVKTTYAPAIFASYQFATNVPVGSDSALLLASSNTNIVSIVANQLQTLATGTATVSATYQGQTAALTVNVVRAPAVLLHRWSFNETSGTIAHDSVGAANGTLEGSAAFTGSGYVNLPNPGSSPQTGNSYVQIPGGLLNNLSAVTVECWVTNNGWNNGNTFLGFSGPIDGNGFGTNYINFYARMYSSISAFEIDTPAGDSGLEALGTRVNDNGVASGIPSHYVYVYDPATSHSITLYTNGILAGSQSGVAIPLSSLGTNVGTIGLSVYNQSQSYTLTQNGGSKINCPYLNGGVSEVRIYNGILTAADVAATQALGPDLILGSNTAVSVKAATSGANLSLSWPVSSATFAVLSSPTLGAGAIWTPVTVGLTVVGGNYQVNLPLTGSNQYFRLQLQ